MRAPHHGCLRNPPHAHVCLHGPPTHRDVTRDITGLGTAFLGICHRDVTPLLRSGRAGKRIAAVLLTAASRLLERTGGAAGELRADRPGDTPPGIAEGVVAAGAVPPAPHRGRLPAVAGCAASSPTCYATVAISYASPAMLSPRARQSRSHNCGMPLAGVTRYATDVARRVGASCVELHRRAYAGDFVPSTPSKLGSNRYDEPLMNH